jgi:tyrosyl-tRNA synthetase
MTSDPHFEITDTVQAAMTVSLRGCAELLPQDDWLRKLARSAATSRPLRIKFGLDPTAPDLHSDTPSCSTRCASCRISDIP